MPLTLDQIRITADLPVLPKTMAAFELSPVSLEERMPGIKRLVEALKLGEPTTVELPYGHAFASPRGEVHYFAASGGLFGRTAAVSKRFTDERRPWPRLEPTREGNDTTHELPPDIADGLTRRAEGLLRDADVLPPPRGALGLTRPQVRLDRWAQFDDDGKTIASGVGAASVHLGYEVEGVPVLGPGAKSQVRFEPRSRSTIEITELFHALRPLAKASTVRLSSAEARLATIVAADRQLQLFHERRQRIRLTLCQFGYYALPVFQPQAFLLPVLRIEGAATLDADRDQEFRFARYLPAVAADAARRAGLSSYQLFGAAKVFDSEPGRK